jgi:hypothetical protein
MALTGLVPATVTEEPAAISVSGDKPPSFDEKEELVDAAALGEDSIAVCEGAPNEKGAILLLFKRNDAVVIVDGCSAVVDENETNGGFVVVFC